MNSLLVSSEIIGCHFNA